MKKKVLSILTVLCMVMSLLPAAALAAGIEYDESLVVQTITEDTVITEDVDGLVAVAAPVSVSVQGAKVTGIILTAEAEGATVSVTDSAEMELMVVLCQAEVKADATTTVSAVAVAAPAAVEIAGTAQSILLVETAAGADVVVAETAKVASVNVQAPNVTATVAGTVTGTVTVSKSAKNAEITVAETAAVNNMTVAAPAAVEIAGEVKNVTVSDSSVQVTVEASATVSNVTNNTGSELNIAGAGAADVSVSTPADDDDDDDYYEEETVVPPVEDTTPTNPIDTLKVAISNLVYGGTDAKAGDKTFTITFTLEPNVEGQLTEVKVSCTIQVGSTTLKGETATQDSNDKKTWTATVGVGENDSVNIEAGTKVTVTVNAEGTVLPETETKDEPETVADVEGGDTQEKEEGGDDTEEGGDQGQDPVDPAPETPKGTPVSGSDSKDFWYTEDGFSTTEPEEKPEEPDTPSQGGGTTTEPTDPGTTGGSGSTGGGSEPETPSTGGGSDPSGSQTDTPAQTNPTNE